MKKILTIITVMLLVSCVEKENDFLSLKGQLQTKGEGLVIIKGRNYRKEIKVNADGTFSDTLRVLAGVHTIIYKKQRLALFLKNGYDLSLAFKEAAFSKGVSFKGVGSETNRYMERKRTFFKSGKAIPKSYFKLPKKEFQKSIAETKLQLEKMSANAPNVDSIILKSDIKNNALFIRFITNRYPKEHENLLRLARGVMSPKFFKYQNYQGGTSSLDDFKGSFVYIDVWATWCTPCKAETPYLKALIAEFKGKNIKFVSLSVDKKTAYNTWKELIAAEKMEGIQLFADDSFESDFIKEYAISAIPRFILLDTEGKIIDANVSRPSDPKTKGLLNYLVN